MKMLSKRWLVFFATVLVHGAATGGRPAASLDTVYYLSLIQSDASATFNVGRLSWMKSFFLVILAGTRAISPAHWMGIMVALNIFCSGVVAVMLVELVKRATRSAIATPVAFFFYLGCFEVVQWMRFILTDLLYCGLSLIPFYLVARRLLTDGEPRRTWLLAISTLLAAFTRQPGVVLVPLILFAELVLIERRVRPKVAATIIIACAIAAIVVRTAAVNDPARWPFAFIKPRLIDHSQREKQLGEVIMGRRETFRPPARSAMDHVIIVADRYVRFFQVTTSGFSYVHNAINVVYFVALYGLGLIGVADAFRRNDRKRRALVIVTLMWIGVFDYLYALTTLDFDWRYRTTLIPHFILLAACGLDALVYARNAARSRSRATGEMNHASSPSPEANRSSRSSSSCAFAGVAASAMPARVG